MQKNLTQWIKKNSSIIDSDVLYETNHFFRYINQINVDSHSKLKKRKVPSEMIQDIQQLSPQIHHINPIVLAGKFALDVLPGIEFACQLTICASKRLHKMIGFLKWLILISFFFLEILLSFYYPFIYYEFNLLCRFSTPI
jgi:hypothetical protein